MGPGGSWIASAARDDPNPITSQACGGALRPAIVQLPIHCSGVGETMAELVAAVPSLLAADQADQHYADAVQTAVAACAEDTEGQTCFICMDGAAEEGLVRGCACRGAAGVAHVSCLARQAQVAVERRSGPSILRWYICGLCEQRYHGVVACALGWACWKTYLGRPERDELQSMAMTQLGNGLYSAHRYDEALSVEEANLSMQRRLGASEDDLLIAQGNLAITYGELGHPEKALSMERDVYSGRLRLYGEEHRETLRGALNYAVSLIDLQRHAEAKSVLRSTVPVARRVLGDSHDYTLTMRKVYAETLYKADGATRDDLSEAVTTLEETARAARRVFGGAHPISEMVAHERHNAEKKLSLHGELQVMGISSLAEAKEMLNAMDAMTMGDNPGPGGA